MRPSACRAPWPFATPAQTAKNLLDTASRDVRERSSPATRVRQSRHPRRTNVDGQASARDTLYHQMGEIVQPFRRHPGYLLIAPLAFVAQITLAFAHIHVHSRELSQAAAAASDTTPVPADEDLDCLFCAAIHVATTLIPAACPSIILPKKTYRIALPVCYAEPGAVARASPFRSRAPP